MTYVMSDVHGCYREYRQELEKIAFSDADLLYIIGDIVDRGPQPMRVLLDMMERPNVIPLLGNHDWMAVCCLRSLIVEGSGVFGQNDGDLIQWWDQGGLTTLEDFYRLSKEEQRRVLAYLGKFQRYEEQTVNGGRYVLVHGGLGGFSPSRPLEDYALNALIWDRPDYGRVYFPDKYLVTGHTPTQFIQDNPRPDFIYRANNHIAIDCGCVFGGRLGAVCLDTGEEYYVDSKQRGR